MKLINNNFVLRKIFVLSESSAPKISVLLPVYNAAEYIAESIQSILNQTFTDFEIILINDCSTDTTADILGNFTDSRIRIINNTVNLKVVKTLNLGLGLARGEFIARMDADDISHPRRFEEQVAYLNANPSVDICGTWVRTFGTEDIIMRPATEHEHIKVRLFFVNPIFHPAVMFRREKFEINNLLYSEAYSNAEDYGLWVTAVDSLKFANIPKVLLKYRIHKANVSVLKESNRQVLDDIHFDIYKFFLGKLKADYTEEQLLKHRKLGLVNVGRISLSELKEYLEWLKNFLYKIIQ